MIDKETVVFIVHTEYHLLQAIGIIESYYHTEKYHPIIYRVSPISNGRLCNINKQYLNADYKEFLYDYRRPDNKIKGWIYELIFFKPSILFLFNEDKFWTTYLLKKLHSISCRIVLAPDGAKVYDNFHLRGIGLFVKYIKNIYFSIRTGLLFPFPSVERCYASNRFIDEVWVEYPQSYINNTRKKVVQYSITEWDRTRTIMNRVFGYDSKDVPDKPIILYIDSSITEESYYNKVIKLLQTIQKLYPEYPLYIKCHPVSGDVARTHFKALENVHFMKTDIPAELIIASLSNSILVSVVSTSMLLNNPSCKYMWFYPYFSEIIDNKSFKNPTTHIKEYSSLLFGRDE